MATQPAAPLGESLDNAEMTSLHKCYRLPAGLGVLLDGFDFFIKLRGPLSAEQYHLSA